MPIRALSAVVLLVWPLAGVLAMDTSPYKVGQTLNADQARELKQRFAARKVQPWRASPDPASIDTHPDARLIRYGIQLLDKTASTIGPMVAEKSRRYSGNNLNCSSCHLKGDSGLPGTKYFGIPFSNVMNDYPNFRARSMTVGSAAERVNGCMTRSMGNGRPLPADSREMRAILAYFGWLAEGTESGMAMRGAGLPELDFPDRPADPAKGKDLYGVYCASCHGDDAKGTRGPQFQQAGGYSFPPLGGEDSFNNGAGMSRLMTAARFVHANMPLGTAADKPALDAEQSYDLAAFIESLPRPERAGRADDFPNPQFRPADYPVPAYFQGDSAALEKARFGPFDTQGKAGTDAGH